jgi:hypothetical protein
LSVQFFIRTFLLEYRSLGFVNAQGSPIYASFGYRVGQ